MLVSNARTPGVIALLAVLWSGAGHANAVTRRDTQEPIVLDAQSADADLTSNHLLFRKVRITQGATSIAADLGQGADQKGPINNTAFNDSLWNFRGNVKISVDEGLLTSDDAQINFVNRLLSKAVVNGKPAAFEQKVTKTGKTAQGHADTINYDAGRHLVLLSKNAWLSDGQTEIHGESLKYNVVAQSIVAEAAEQGSQRVHIVITPPPSKP